MCDEASCPCTLERRHQRRAEHIARSEALRGLAFRLSKDGHLTDGEVTLLYRQADQEWDDAIHIASMDDPLRSLCGSYGRNLVDLPNLPDWLNGFSGCWGCLTRADELARAEWEMATA